MRKDREKKDKAEAAGGDVDLMDEENDEDEVPSITVYVAAAHCSLDALTFPVQATISKRSVSGIVQYDVDLS